MLYNEMVADLNNSPFRQLINMGVPPEAIRDTIVQVFSPFFANSSNLTRYANDFLIHDFINYVKRPYDRRQEAIIEVINLFRSAQEIDSSKTFSVFAGFVDKQVDISNIHWSLLSMRKDLNELGNYEYTVENFLTIENICEVMIKKFLHLAVYLQRLSLGKYTDFKSVEKIKFGNLINEVKQGNKLITLMALNKSEVSVSQWRNIACHKSFAFVHDKVECTYGSHSEFKVIISNQDLYHIADGIYNIAQSLNYAIKFYFYDNIESISPIYKSMEHTNASRPEDWQLIFVTELYIQGFSVLDIEDHNDHIKVILQDLTEQNQLKRAIASSIAIYKLWMYVKKENIEVIYSDINGKHLFSSKLDSASSVCMEIATGKQNVSYLGEHVTFTILNG